MELKGSKTEQNLMTAFAGEAQAYTKYQYYQSQAKKDGYVQISKFFEETARNEKEHAKLWFKLLHDGIADTTVNLKDAAAGENYEWTEMYKEFAQVAREEGFESSLDSEGLLTFKNSASSCLFMGKSKTILFELC
jgi:rubrerythrin